MPSDFLTDGYVERFRNESDENRKILVGHLNQEDRQYLQKRLEEKQGEGGGWWNTLTDVPVIGDIAESGMKGLQWWHENWSEPIAGNFYRGVTMALPGEQPGEERMREAGWGWRSAQEEYQETDLPWGVKGTMEIATDPITYVTGAGLLGAGAKGLASLGLRGAATQAARAGAKVGAVEAFPTLMVGKGVGKAFRAVKPRQEPTRWLEDLVDFDTAAEIAFQPNNARKLAQIPGVKQIAGRLNPAAVADDPAKAGLILRAAAREEGKNKALGGMSRLQQIGNQDRVFGKLTDEGYLKGGAFEGRNVTLNTIRSNPKKHWNMLDDKQREWVTIANKMEDEKLDLLTRNGIEINELSFADGGRYAGRKVYGKVNPNGEIEDVALIGHGQPGRPGYKLSAEKERIFDTAEDAIEAGYRYIPEDEALYFNMVGAYNRIADKQFADWFLDRVPWRTIGTPDSIKAWKYATQTQRKGAEKTLQYLQRAKRGEKIPPSALKAMERNAPDIYKAYKESGVTDDLIKQAKANIENAKASQKEAMQASTDTAKSMQKHFDEATLHDVPAFAGKVFTGPDAKKTVQTIRDGMNPKFSQALNSVNKANSVGRFFALAGDVSPFSIQLIALAAHNPRAYMSAMKGFVKAFFDPEYQAKYIAKHADTIQNSPDLILTKGGGSEFTEAVAQRGLLQKKPLNLITKGFQLERFQRGFESALDTAGIELREAYEHLATTPARRAEVEQFINEIRGVTSSARLGVTAGQRQIETAIILAPRYNRAVASLLLDVFQGNLRGSMARRAIGKTVAAGAALTVGITVADEMRKGKSFDEAIELATQRLDPTSPEFCNFEVAGQRIGVGSKMRSLAKLWGEMGENPSEMGSLALKFGKGNMSPALSTGYDLFTGKDYIGDPTRDNVLHFSETVFAENLLPLWVQSTLIEGGGNFVTAAGEFAGLRTIPRSDWDRRDEMRERLAQDKYDAEWEDLNDMEKDAIRNEHSDLAQLEEKITDDWTKQRGSKTEKIKRYIEKTYDEKRDNELQEYSAALYSGAINFNRYNDLRSDAMIRFGASRQIAYALKAEMGEGSVDDYEKYVMESKKPEDQAYYKYNQYFNDPEYQVRDEYGIIDWYQTQKKADSYMRTLDKKTQDYIREKQSDWVTELEEPLRSVEIMRQKLIEALTPYWRVKDQVIDGYNARNAVEQYRRLVNIVGKDVAEQREPRLAALIDKINADVRKVRQQLRQANQNMDNAVRIWYGRNVI